MFAVIALYALGAVLTAGWLFGSNYHFFGALGPVDPALYRHRALVLSVLSGLAWPFMWAAFWSYRTERGRRYINAVLFG